MCLGWGGGEVSNRKLDVTSTKVTAVRTGWAARSDCVQGAVQDLFVFLDYRTAALRRRWRLPGTKWRNAACRSTLSSGPLELSNSQKPSSTAGFFSCLGRYHAPQKFPKAVCFRSSTLTFTETSSLSFFSGILQPIILFSCFKIIIFKRHSLWFDELPQKLERAHCCLGNFLSTELALISTYSEIAENRLGVARTKHLTPLYLALPLVYPDIYWRKDVNRSNAFPKISHIYLLLRCQLQMYESDWVIPTVAPMIFAFLRAFLRWHRWAAENKNQEVVAALKYQFNCCRMAFSLWKKRLAQKVEADQRFRCHLHQMTAGALLHWHSYCQSKLHHPTAAFASV